MVRVVPHLSYQRALAAGVLGAVLSGASAEAKPPAFLTPAEVPRVSTELFDTSPQSRAQFSSRSLIGDGDEVFGRGSAHAVEVDFNLAVSSQWALVTQIPFGFVSSGFAGTDEILFGNLSFGFIHGGNTKISKTDPHWLLLGFGVDLFFPTAPDDTEPSGAPMILSVVRSAAPQLYLPGLFSQRFRGQIGFLLDQFRVRSEVHFVTGLFLDDVSPFVTLTTAILDLSYDVSNEVELFVQTARTTQTSGAGDISLPFTVTPGARVRFSSTFSVAVYPTFNFEEATALIIGVDVGALYEPPTRRPGFLGEGEF